MLYATTERALLGAKTNSQGDRVVRMQSSSNPNKFYNVDITNGRCSCPAWIHQKNGRKPCKHLRALGFTAVHVTDVVAEYIHKEQASEKQTVYTGAL